MKNFLLWLLWLVSRAAYALACRLSPPQPDRSWCAWARHWGDGRSQWQVIARRPTLESCWACVGQWLHHNPQTSACVLPEGIRPEEPPPACEPAEGAEP